MNRSEFATLLGAPAGLRAEAGREATVIEAGDPRRFMAELAVAVAQGGTVMLASTAWGENERRQLAALRQMAPDNPPAAAGKGWLCIPTGGNSGQLKFARHDEGTLSAAVHGFTRHFAVAQVNAVGVLPLHHVSGLMAWMRCALSGGEYLPLEWKSVEAGRLPPLPAKPQGWMISFVPTQLDRLLRHEAAVDWLRKFRLIFLGSGPAWPGLLAKAAAAQLPLSLGYGMTESAAMVTALHPAEFLAGARSCGTALPHARVKLSNEGGIFLGGDSMFRGYHPQWRDGWDFETEDRGRLDQPGHLHVTGRRDLVIITGGEKVDPVEVETVLRDTGELTEIVVLGVPDAEWGHVIVAAYPEAARPDLDKVAVAVSRLLAPAKRPKRFVPIANWPVNSQGKVNRTEVARLVGDALRSTGKPGA
jgi:o-succinylbenzoate---CoA ligase